MKCVLISLSLVLLGMFAFADNAIYLPRPYAFGIENQPWWRIRMKNEEFRWVDHTGKTNTAIRPLFPAEKTPEDTRVSDSREVSAVIAHDFTVKSYTILSARLNPDGSYNINQIAPGTYDLTKNEWYPEMSDEEKHRRWSVYTNDYIQAILKDEAERKAPAKFDVSRTPEEYKAYLLADRDPETLTPEEEYEIDIEYSIYQLEWTRVNDPDHYKRIPFPKGKSLSEQEKKRRSEGLEIRRMLRSKLKK